MMRKVVISSPIFAAAVVSSSEKGYVHTYEGGAKKEGASQPLLLKPSELPIYKSARPQSVEDHHSNEQKKSAVAEAIESGFRATRESIQTVTSSFSDQQAQLSGYIEHAKDQTKFIVDYLNEEDNTVPRISAVAVGGFAGFIFGVRGGFFKKLIYTSIGAAGVASVCYPKEAKIYTEKALVQTKKYTLVAYNFVYGVKPGDKNQKELPIPNIPTNLEDLKKSLSDLGKSTFESIFPEKK